ncbi:MAG: ABC transporter ATP-binding protein [Opitutaceae bacterium]|nr:ABC transporter ATP-binding protein [Cytophagales bacterium]
MLIHLESIGKRFLKDWIFRNVNLEFEGTKKYAITGLNGSGKSTFLQLLAGLSIPTEGKISYRDEAGIVLDPDNISLQFSYSAPYQELPEELTAEEIFDFHFNFRNKASSFDQKVFFEMIELPNQQNKQVKYFSSGMKQRLKLGLCLFTDSKVYFLDEPTTNLDRNGIEWYKRLISERISDKSLFISSNIEEEYQLCDTVIQISDYK